MVNDHVSLRLESNDFSCDKVQVFELSGREVVGQLFELTIQVVCTTAEGLDVEQVEGATASLVFESLGLEVRRVNGMIAQIDDLLDTEPDTRTYRLLLVPRAHRLSLVKAQEIFMDLSVPEILQKKLEAVGLSVGEDVEMRLAASYPKREFVVQYKETDLAFVSRLAEHEGISFFFEHDAVDKIVFNDSPAGFPLTPGHETAPFRARGDRRDVYHLEARTRVVPRVHVVHDYNYRTPQVEVTGTHEAASGLAGGVVDHGSHAKTPDDAQRLARIRAEETEATHRVYSVETDLAWMAAGARFTIDGHPKLGDVPLLITEIEHACVQPVALHGGGTQRPYVNKLRAVSAELTYRPPRVTPSPKIHGVIHGTIAHEVEGTETIFARLDDQGRYLVRMMYDQSPAGERPLVSRRIRMAQPHTGANYGHHFPLKPGMEVLIVCIDGDPDRPIIIATVPNPVTSSPVAQNCAPAHRIKTATGILIEMKDA
jgi:type VI secretion system secreted protein VgrG